MKRSWMFLLLLLVELFAAFVRRTDRFRHTASFRPAILPVDRRATTFMARPAGSWWTGPHSSSASFCRETLTAALSARTVSGWTV